VAVLRGFVCPRWLSNGKNVIQLNPQAGSNTALHPCGALTAIDDSADVLPMMPEFIGQAGYVKVELEKKKFNFLGQWYPQRLADPPGGSLRQVCHRFPPCSLAGAMSIRPTIFRLSNPVCLLDSRMSDGCQDENATINIIRS
jgi:hypothetical protein